MPYHPGEQLSVWGENLFVMNLAFWMGFLPSNKNDKKIFFESCVYVFKSCVPKYHNVFLVHCRPCTLMKPIPMVLPSSSTPQKFSAEM